MPKHISTTKKFMLDPALRCKPASLGGDKDERRDYENSVAQMPSIWSWKTLGGMASTYSIRTKHSKSTRVDSMDTIQYFPFCEELYNFATSASRCNWLHIVGKTTNQLTTLTTFLAVAQTPK
jgi:hypothetical protein